MKRLRLYPIAGILLLLGFFLLAPKILPEMKIHLFVEILIYALWAVAFNLLFGHGGLLAFGFGAPFGVGAYVTALIFRDLAGIPLLLTLGIVCLTGFATGILIGSLAVRLKGAYFALITFAFQMFFYAIALKWYSVTLGDDGFGVRRPSLGLPLLGELAMKDVSSVYYFTLAVVALAVLGAYYFQKTPLGNSIALVRENDVRPAFLGYNVYLVRLTVFSVSCLLAALAGGLFVFFNEFVSTAVIDMNVSMVVLLMVIIGGSDRFLGPVLGAAFYVLVQNWLSSLTSHWFLVLGAIFIIVVLYLEGGLISLFRRKKAPSAAEPPRR
jgi:branched-chain amino acid transport system permease protein